MQKIYQKSPTIINYKNYVLQRKYTNNVYKLAKNKFWDNIIKKIN